ncbi:MAG: heterodisulfide reductase-related iron-sulfur binding cluster [Vicinamibacterales bacterium]|nr:glycolate oxidase [Acidobacteriota bacterium]MDP6608541.1 heterodisulfide reductase-related iron-sulfur binding cluster [Vicinamibacterales bacterium]
MNTASSERRARLAACVHCGFCLPSCPTYVLWRQEMDSPRGRLHLMRAEADGRVPIADALVRRMDACLGCLACTTACPSGVDYGPLIEQTRAGIEAEFRRPLADRLFRTLVFQILPYPGRLRWVAALMAAVTSHGDWLDRRGWLDRLPARLGALVRLAPRSVAAGRSLPARTPAEGTRRATVGLLTGCVQRVFFADVNRATARVLAAEGCDVVAPVDQGCCGALALHAGREREAKTLARRVIAAFERSPVDRIAVNVAGCGAAMKEYGRLFVDDPEWAERAAAFAARVGDVTEVLDEIGPTRATRHPIDARIGYHDACHLAHGQGVRAQPRRLLEAIPGVSVVTPAAGELCCGSAGIYNLVQPEAAAALGARKIAAILDLDADLVATGNAGCLLQLAAAGRTAGQPVRLVHPIEIVDAAIRGTRL